MTTIQSSVTKQIPGYIKVLKGDKLSNFAKSAAGAVVATSVLKATGRPAFIFADKTADANTKKYSATKEFLYQILCMGIALSAIPLFKRGGYKLAEKFIKDKDITKVFKDIKDKVPYVTHKKLEEAQKLGGIKRFLDKLENTEKPSKAMQTVNGSIELGALIGTVIGMAIIAPLISLKILHPVMHAVGLEENSGASKIDAEGSQSLGSGNNSINADA